MHGSICGIEYFLPAGTITNTDLRREFADFDFAKLSAKTGIMTRHVASANESSTDLAFAAAERLLSRDVASAINSIDYLLVCTQSPEYVLPATACILQDRLGIPKTAGALDFNLGCSGFVYGLGIAEGLIVSGQARRILLITSDTITRYIAPSDSKSRALFGDAAAAILVETTSEPHIGPFVYGTDGSGMASLIVHGDRFGKSYAHLQSPYSSEEEIDRERYLVMDGAKVFAFALQEVPVAVARLLESAALSTDDIALFVFHQANRYLIEELYRVLKIPQCKQQYAISDCGNTSSSSIPIALHQATTEGRIAEGDRIVIVGFGVGFSWGATMVRWSGFPA